jgi:hypothetical protein
MPHQLIYIDIMMPHQLIYTDIRLPHQLIYTDKRMPHQLIYTAIRMQHQLINAYIHRHLNEALRDRPFNLKGGGGGIVFCFVQKKHYVMTKTLNQIIFFFLHQNQNIFFQLHWESEYFFSKKTISPPLSS